MKSSFLDKVSNISGFSYLRLTVRKIIINIIINRAIILELILVNTTITFQSESVLRKQILPIQPSIKCSMCMKVKTT